MGFKNVSPIIDGRLFLGKSVFAFLKSAMTLISYDSFPIFSLVSAQSTRSLTERRITHIVSVCTEPIPAEHPQSGIRHMRVPVQDAHHEDLLIWMPSVCRFVDEALNAGGVVLIHGVHGLSRGATIMAAYGRTDDFSTPLRSILTSVGPVMWSGRVSAPEALDVVRRRKAVFILVCFDRFSPTFFHQIVSKFGRMQASLNNFHSSKCVGTHRPWMKESMCAGARTSTVS